MIITNLFIALFSQLPISALSATAFAAEPAIQYPDVGAYRFRFEGSHRCLSGPIKLTSQEGYGMSLRSQVCMATQQVTDQQFFIPKGWNDSTSDPDTGPFRLIESRPDWGMCVKADYGYRPMYANCMRLHADSWHIHAISPGHVTIELPETGRCMVDEERSDYIRMGDCASPRAVMIVTQVSRR
jgi:hypothetical protein